MASLLRGPAVFACVVCCGAIASKYEVGCYPDGQSVWFTDRLRAVAEYAVRELRAIGEIAGYRPDGAISRPADSNGPAD